ncbi:MAE_28990/MAE_18760 family HEPN-like nuclease [Chromobacterium alticapitis]|uniref:MAE_28990/MAE_18760 family HEPN-like nuclease n=1 Tax=Chromobacterium alticapitis TaxID=2073169 RepID=UPI0011B0C16D|nr:MAE_28990/MAE_18760 family HEPN-like nuclease [Chromobacterium alticapitis]
MRGVIVDLEDREYSIGRLLDHIDDVGETRGKVDVIVVLKSSVFIALYNNIEATVYSVVERIHDSASSLTYDEIAAPLRMKMLRYSFGKTASAFVKDQQKVSEEELKFRTTSQTFPEFSDFLRRQSLFSGNVDARKLNVIGVSYGVAKLAFSRQDADKMLWVKNKRNKIAHGEQSMSDGGQGIKTSDLRRAAISVGKILRDFICAVELYLNENGYRSSP